MGSESLEEQLRLACLPELAPAELGRAPEEAAIEAAAQRLRAAEAPALAGLHGLTIEGLRAAHALAERLGASLFLEPPEPDALFRGVTASGTLAELAACDLLLRVGVEAGHPVARWLAERVERVSDLAATSEAVIAFRDEPDATLADARRVGVLLAPDCDPSVASQWHRWAGRMQRSRRVFVLTPPAAGGAADERGALETLTWLAGAAPDQGGLRATPAGFARTGPWPSAPEARASDVVLDAAPAPLPLPNDKTARIRLGAARAADAAVTLPAPGLAPGLGARIMRFDGPVLWLCEDPDRAPADPAAATLFALAERVGGNG